MSKVPAALNCLNRATKSCADREATDFAYELKFRVLLVCARLGWARDCHDRDGYVVDRYRFHSLFTLDCRKGNAVRHVNLDRERIDDVERAQHLLEAFLRAHPHAEDEEAILEAYREHVQEEHLAYDDRCAARELGLTGLDEVFENGDDDDLEDDEAF